MSNFLLKNQNPAFLNSIILTASCLIAVSSVVLPFSVFITIFAALIIILPCIVRPDYALYLVIILTMVDTTSLYLDVRAHINGLTEFAVEPRFFPFIIPLIAGFTGWLAARASGTFPPRNRTPLDSFLYVIVTYECLSILWGPDLLYSTASALSILSDLLLFYFITSMIHDVQMLRRACVAWIIGGIIGAIGIFLSSYYDFQVTVLLIDSIYAMASFGEVLERPSGFGGHNHIAGYCGMAMAFCMAFALHHQNYLKRTMYILITILMFVAILYTESRGALIGAIGAGIFFIYIHPVFKNSRIRSSIFYLIIVGFLILLFNSRFIDRILIGFGYRGELFFTAEDAYFSGTESVTESVSGTMSRTKWWINGLQEMTNHPWKLLIGLGIGGFPYYSEGSPDTNNTILWFFYDMGLFGMIMYLIFLWIMIQNVHECLVKGKHEKSYYLFIGILTACILEPGIHGLIELDWAMGGSRLVWLPLSFLMSAIFIIKREFSSQSIGKQTSSNSFLEPL